MSRNLLTGLVGAWCPSLGPSGYALLDRSGRGNHGTLTNMDAGSDWVGTPGGWALDYDGTNDYVNCGTSRQLQPAECSYFAWIKPNATQSGTYNQIMGWDSGNSFTSVSTLLLKSNLKLAFYVSGGPYGSYDGNGSITLSAGVWQCVVVTMNAQASVGYVDAKVDLSVSGGTATGTSGSFWIGAQNNYPRAYTGQIADAAVWSRSLTATEVRQLYQLGQGGLGRLLTQRAQRRVFRTQAAVKSYLFLNRGQVIGGGTL